MVYLFTIIIIIRRALTSNLISFTGCSRYLRRKFAAASSQTSSSSSPLSKKSTLFTNTGNQRRSLARSRRQAATLSTGQSSISSTMGSETTTSIVWFRKGLRIHDNPALSEALREAKNGKDDSKNVLPLFILDPWFCNEKRVGANRMNFLLQSLANLNENLGSLSSIENVNANNCLTVVQGKPKDVLPNIIKKFNVSSIYFEKEQVEPFGKQRDEEIIEICKKLNVGVKTYASHTLYDQEFLLSKASAKGIPPSTMGAFQKVLANVGEPPSPVPTPPKNSLRVIPDAGDVLSKEFKYANGIPTLEDLGYEAKNLSYKGGEGGETEGLRRMRGALRRGGDGYKYVQEFDKPQSSPCQIFAKEKGNGKASNPFEMAKKASSSPKEESLLWPSTTALSPHLKFGTVSVRQFYYELQDILKNELKGKHTKPPTSLMGQILWREFYYVNACGTPNYDRMVGNRICKQIPWKNDPEVLAKWENAQTGFPWIDAAMIQLKKEGWMHHLARHAVACFLTRGDLFISWEEGARVFDRDLVDADWALNNGNWMWLSASSFFYQYFRVYGPHSFAKKYDKEGAYVKHFLPVLKNMPSKYIYEPWTAPLEVQKKAGCVVGVDYPKPMVDHAIASKQCMAWMSEAYGAGKDTKSGGEERSNKKAKTK